MEAVKLKWFLVGRTFPMSLLREADGGGRPASPSAAELCSFSCGPPTSTSLMAFYGSLESLWLLLTQWDLLLMGDGGAGGGGVYRWR